MKFIGCRVFTAVLALVLVFSLFLLPHEHTFSRERSLSVSRKLLSSSLASFSTSIGKISGSKKQHKKVVEPSLRKAPPSIPNPTQNNFNHWDGSKGRQGRSSFPLTLSPIS
ncbi:hypothetical protein VNO77_17184 [Canavalia gladiata]|uniref:Uncharacterized protein n=1 Tax=Canavalia gladiata TaxID=3824 RepID=A0AAN9LND4_CANGL